MTSEQIKTVLDSGVCPTCKSEVLAAKGMKVYYCTKDKSHFHLEVMFHGGLSISAKLNGIEISSEELRDIEW
ncbi:MAG: hypothetical protein ACW99A_00840 [Candidatus Kariarchaeaceae archaeon]|jgi:hypothetical protein